MEGGQLHSDLARVAKEREVDTWKQIKVSNLLREGRRSNAVVDTRCGPGERRFVAELRLLRNCPMPRTASSRY